MKEGYTALPAMIRLHMSFARRYITSIVAPPAIVTLPLAFLFVTQVVQLSLGTAFLVIALLLLLGGGTAAALFAGVTPAAHSVEEAVARKHGVSRRGVRLPAEDDDAGARRLARRRPRLRRSSRRS